MKSLKHRLKKQDSAGSSDWNKYDERLLKAVENGDTDKVTATLKKGVIPTKLDADGSSTFHRAASKGLINCINVFLGHGVDVKAACSTGKTALHYSAGNGHSSCVQRLLQCNCPINGTDLQGRTALHEAAYGGYNAVAKFLCDNGASVNAADKDGRTPLLLAAHRCHPGMCQLLLQCGATVTHHDNQRKEGVEVLLKGKADVTAVDAAGHDVNHYARLSCNQELVLLVRTAWDAAHKAREAPKPAPKIQQREHGGQRPEGKDAVLPSPPRGLDSAQTRQGSAQSGLSFRGGPRPAEEVSGETEVLRRELREARRRQEATEAEVLRLEAALALRGREYEELRRNSDCALRDARARAWELEEALAEVQRRMAGSEARVRQMQAHLVAVREHLVEELRVQLQEARGQREAVVAELGRMQRDLEQSRREAQEQRENRAVLAEEVHRLSSELVETQEDRKKTWDKLATVEVSLRAKEVSMVSQEVQTTESGDAAQDLPAGATQQNVVEEECVSVEDHEAMKGALSSALMEAEAKAQEAQQKYQGAQVEMANLLQELQEQRSELDTIQEALKARFVPLATVEEKDKELLLLRQTVKELEEKSTHPPQEPPPTPDPPLVSEGEPQVEATKGSGVQGQGKGQQGLTDGGSAPLATPEDVAVCGSPEPDGSLQALVLSLQQQLESSERHHQGILSIYRARLLSAAQGYMDEEARVALLQIAQLRQECVY